MAQREGLGDLAAGRARGDPLVRVPWSAGAANGAAGSAGTEGLSSCLLDRNVGALLRQLETQAWGEEADAGAEDRSLPGQDGRVKGR